MKTINLWSYDYGKSNAPIDKFVIHLKDLDNVFYRGELEKNSILNKDEKNIIIVSYKKSHGLRSVLKDDIIEYHIHENGVRVLYTYIYEYCSFNDDGITAIPEEIKDEVFLDEASFCHNSFVQRKNILGFNPFYMYYTDPQSWMKTSFNTLTHEVEILKERDLDYSCFLGILENRHFRKDFKNLLSKYLEKDKCAVTWYPDNIIEKTEIHESGFCYDVRPEILKSKFHIVFESRTVVPSITEKMFKPLIGGVPFIWMAYPNLLKYFKKLNYKKYDFINYEFDSIENPGRRYESLVEEFLRLKNDMTQSDIDENMDTILYNRDNFFNNYNNYKQEIYEALLEL